MQLQTELGRKVLDRFEALLASGRINGSCCIQAGSPEDHDTEIIILGDMSEKEQETFLETCVDNARKTVVKGYEVKGVGVFNKHLASCFGLETWDQNDLMAQAVIGCMLELDVLKKAAEPIRYRLRKPEDPADNG